MTVGLLVFLGIDAMAEGNEIAGGNVAGVFNGQVLTAMVTINSFLSLLYISEKSVERATAKKQSPPSSNTFTPMPIHYYLSMI